MTDEGLVTDGGRVLMKQSFIVWMKVLSRTKKIIFLKF